MKTRPSFRDGTEHLILIGLHAGLKYNVTYFQELTSADVNKNVFESSKLHRNFESPLVSP